MDILRVIAETRGVFLRSEARDLGYDDRAVEAAVRAKVWFRVRRGAYTFGDIWEGADDVGRHQILARAVMRSLGNNVALSHTSSAIEQGCDVWDVDLSHVHVTRLDGGAGRTEKDVVHHEGSCSGDSLVETSGMLMTHGARAVAETASLSRTESGLVVADSALHRNVTDRDGLDAAFKVMGHWPFTQKLHIVLGLADGRSESVGESRSRYLCWSQGLPAPTPQFEVYNEQGVLVGTTDFAWPEHRLLGEFDGKVKYGRYLKPGESPGDAVFREKRREDLLREITHWAMVRLVWGDLYYARETAARIRALLTQPARPFTDFPR